MAAINDSLHDVEVLAVTESPDGVLVELSKPLRCPICGRLATLWPVGPGLLAIPRGPLEPGAYHPHEPGE